jgi:caffeoyl-CoA O-methyltransferase
MENIRNKVNSMKLFVPEEIEKYITEHTSDVPALLDELERETIKTMEEARMLTGAVEARLLQLLVKISGAAKVVEIGTFTGYSALMMAEGLPEDGELVTCEISEEHAAFARRYFMRSPHAGKIHLKVGPALETLSGIADESVDFIFIDADKTSYPLYYRESLRILRKGGLMAADNALWGGKVLHPDDADSSGVARFNEMVKEDRGVEKVILTVRDGVYLIRKKG